MNGQWLEFLLAMVVLLLPMAVAWFLLTKGNGRKRGSKPTPQFDNRARHGKQ